MQKILGLTLAAMMLLVATPGMALNLTPTAPSQDFVNNGQRVYLRHDYESVADHPGTGLIVRENCNSDDAVAGFYCTTGQHDTSFYYILIGFNINQPGLTGILEQVVSSDAGEVRFRCTWNNGSWTGCQIISATWPGAGNAFQHDIWAYGQVLPRSAPLPYNGAITAPAGLPGATGDWSGYIDHA